LTPEQKQSGLKRYRAIILATLDYLLERFGGGIVYDQFDPAADYYEQQKIQSEKYYKQHRLDRLQQQLDRLTKGLQNSVDLNFAGYIKEKTGYDIDIFENLRKRVDAIVAQKEIRSQKELNDIGTALHYYQQTSADKKVNDELRALIIDYTKQNTEPSTSATSGNRKDGYSEVISNIEKDGIEEVTMRISTGPKPKHLEEQEAISPDGKRKLRVTQWSDGKHASTYVAIEFPTASGAIYGTNGIRPDVKAFWKNNHTIVIETKKDYESVIRYKEIRSYEDLITIEYIED